MRLCSIGMICKTSFNAFQSILYARLDEMPDAEIDEHGSVSEGTLK